MRLLVAHLVSVVLVLPGVVSEVGDEAAVSGVERAVLGVRSQSAAAAASHRTPTVSTSAAAAFALARAFALASARAFAFALALAGESNSAPQAINDKA